MDFASALEDLERTADAASSGRGGGSQQHSHHHPRGNNGGGGAGGGRRRGRSEDYNSPPHHHHHHHNRRNQRPRYNSNQSHHHHPRGYSNGGRHGGRHHHHGAGPPPSGNPLDGMRRFGYRIEEPPVAVKPPENMGQPNGKRPFHIALLAICIDGLPYEHIWRAWAQTGGPDCHTQVSLIAHAKFPQRVQSEFLKQRLLVHPPKLGRGNSYADPEYVTHQPNWGSVQITRAMMDLIRDALVIGTPNDREKDPRFTKSRYRIMDGSKNNTAAADPLPPVDKFIFISETCVPVATLAEFEQALFGSPDLYTSAAIDASPVKITPWHLSWVHARNRNTPGTPRNKYERDQFGEIFRMVPGQYRWKADQWMALSRPHASAIANMDAHLPSHAQLWNSFSKISASDEMYFPSALAVLQIIKDPKVVMKNREQQQQQQQSSTTESKEEKPSGGDGPKEEEDDDAEVVKEESEPKEDTKESEETESATATNSGPTVESLSPTVLFKSVTYTDWSEGMRNPKSFFRGPNDLRTISRLARQQGSLLGRKFILCAPTDDVAGKAPEELSGYISVDTWKQVVEESIPLATNNEAANSTEDSV